MSISSGACRARPCRATAPGATGTRTSSDREERKENRRAVPKKPRAWLNLLN